MFPETPLFVRAQYARNPSLLRILINCRLVFFGFLFDRSPAGMFGGKAPLCLAAQKSRPHALSVPMRSALLNFFANEEYKLE